MAIAKSTENRVQRTECKKISRDSCVFVICCLLSVFYCLPSVCHAEVLTSTGLITKAGEYDNKVVVYEGELIGSVLKRDAFAWLNVHDGENALSVWAAASKLEGIAYSGGYKMRGDRLRVEGVFHRACPEHGGALDIHATEVVVTSPGFALPEVLDRKKISILAFLLGVFACLLIIHIGHKRWQARHA